MADGAALERLALTWLLAGAMALLAWMPSAASLEMASAAPARPAARDASHVRLARELPRQEPTARATISVRTERFEPNLLAPSSFGDWDETAR